MADQTKTAGTQAAPAVREVVVRIDHGFEYRGAFFESEKYYRIRDEPANFIDWHITHNLNGALVDEGKVPADAEVLPDPRPAAYDADAARQRDEKAAILASQQPPAQPQVAPVAGTAAVATTSDTLFGGTETGAGRVAPQTSLGSPSEPASAPASTSVSSANSPRLPRAAGTS